VNVGEGEVRGREVSARAGARPSSTGATGGGGNGGGRLAHRQRGREEPSWASLGPVIFFNVLFLKFNNVLMFVLVLIIY